MPPKKKTTAPRKKSKSHSSFLTWQRIKPFAKWGSVVVVVAAVYICWDMPGTDDVKPLDVRPSITVLANDGTVLARYGGMQGNVVNVDDLPDYVEEAVMAIEDRRFYKHFGVDPLGLMRAMTVNLMQGHFAQGGSTITQQLAKNLFLTPDKTLRRKIQEALLALQIEYKYSKKDIMSAYLNRVYFGAGAYGIDAAARTYFDKPASKLTLFESAILAGVLKAPSRYSPSANPARARERAMTVIKAMEDAGFITEKKMDHELSAAKTAKAGTEVGDYNRYFAEWVINQIDSYVSNSDRDLVVKTTLSARMQKMAEDRQEALFKTIKPEEKISEMALVTLAKDGAVLAMLGGQDYKKSQFNRATQARRQPGSLFKTFVYLAAIEAGFTPDDMIEDAPFTSGSYRPENHEGKYYGTVSMTQALAFSLNTATIRLLSDIGMSRLMSVTDRLGFTQKFKSELSTGLGADESTLLELTNAYATIGNGGHAVWPYAVLSIEDTKKNVLYSREETGHAQLFDGSNIAALDSMLVQVIARGTGQAAQLSRGHTAGKTGTSQNYRDAWFIGYTDNLVTGIWMGNDNDSPMNRISGGRYPARLWRDYMEGAITVNLPSFGQRVFATESYTPVNVPQPEAVNQEEVGGGSFADMIGRWSSDVSATPPQPSPEDRKVTPSHTPVYNN